MGSRVRKEKAGVIYSMQALVKLLRKDGQLYISIVELVLITFYFWTQLASPMIYALAVRGNSTLSS
jgi:hypothetical protein